MSDPFRDIKRKGGLPGGDPVDKLRAALVEVEADLEQRRDELAKLGGELRRNPDNVELRNQVQSLKREIAPLCDKQGEVARAISTMLSGNQHRPT